MDKDYHVQNFFNCCWNCEFIQEVTNRTVGTQNFKKFHQALKRHQEILAELAGSK